MSRRKTNDATQTGLDFSPQQTVPSTSLAGALRERWKVVFKDERVFISGVAEPAGSLIPWTQITIRIVFWQTLRLRLFHLSLPRPVRSLRRYQHPLARQLIESTMRMGQFHSSVQATRSAPWAGTQTKISGRRPVLFRYLSEMVRVKSFALSERTRLI